MRNQIPEDMIDRPSFEHTNRFLEANRLFYNGAITDQVNVRAYINQIAPFFLCHLSIKAGKFYMTPAFPTDNTGAISLQPIPIAGYFNDGNIVNGSFKLNVLDISERKDFRCVMKYRDSVKNSMPQYKTIQMKYKDVTIIPDQQEFDVTQFVTTAEHAKMAARYLLASRRRVDHTVEFSTSPFGIALAQVTTSKLRPSHLHLRLGLAVASAMTSKSSATLLMERTPQPSTAKPQTKSSPKKSSSLTVA